MADVATAYTLTTDGGVVTFNNGALGDGTDKYWLTAIQGLDGPVIRAPVDLVPFGDGGIIHTFRKGPRRIVMDGILLIESSTAQSACMELRNDLVVALSSVLDGCLTDAGNLVWTPDGQASLLIQVFYEIGLSVTYSDNYAVANFNFGLVSAAADPVA